MKQWQCSCGAWVHVAYGRHPHVRDKNPGIEAYRAMREAQEAGLTGVVADAFQQECEITYHWRTGQEPTRDALP